MSATMADGKLAGRTALICGSSAGIGRACAEALAQAGARITINARSALRLREVAEEISVALGITVDHVAADVSTAEGRRKLLAACPEPDILVTNAAGPKPGYFGDFGDDEWMAALSASMVAPLMLIRSVVDGMAERNWGRIINITSGSVKAPLPMLALSNGARTGFTGAIAGLAREVAGLGVTINNILPGKIETERLQDYVAAIARGRATPPHNASAAMIAGIPARRFGTPAEVGALCAFLASPLAAFITAQNILIDGGEFTGLI